MLDAELGVLASGDRLGMAPFAVVGESKDLSFAALTALDEERTGVDIDLECPFGGGVGLDGGVVLLFKVRFG